MILHSQFRGHPSPPVDEVMLAQRQVTVGRALESFLVYELGYGGRVTRVFPELIEVKTVIPGWVDRVLFQGTEKELAPLLQALTVFLQVKQKPSIVVDSVWKQLEGENALILSHLGPILVGASIVKLTVLCLLGLTNPEEIEFAMSMEVQSLVACLDLYMQGERFNLREVA